jgi:CheY-like chemotaxis protein
MLEMLDDSRTAAIRIRDIIRDLSLFARAESPQQHNVVVQDVIEATLRMANAALSQRAQLETHYAPLPLVFASESRLGQVFLNLVMNAVQALEEGHPERNRIRVDLLTDAEGAAVVEITDTGCGMSEGTLKRIFSPFFTTKPSGIGTGLGLSICRRIVMGFGGTIQATSELGRGTTIRVRLLPSEAKEADPAHVKRSWRAMPQRARVMTIDDDPKVARVLERMLSPHHDVTVFHSAREALQCICAGNRYDIILCDLMMPDWTGMDFLEHLTSRCRDQAARVVIVTGGGFTPHAQAFLEQTGIARLNKPVELDQVLGLIGKYLSLQ